jgi:exodeoxyribonuclease VII large subunit
MRDTPACYKRAVVQDEAGRVPSEGRDVLSVADLTRRLRVAVEGATGRDWVEGEIGSLKRAQSGHVYFTLKDSREDACLECVMYRLNAQRARRHLFEGGKVQAFGRATLWEPRGRLQFVIQDLRGVGLGSLLEQLEALKQKLYAEGLFAPERKRRLPAAPQVVGVVTSAHGAALHDIRTVAFRRGRVTLVLSQAIVQGELAPASLVAALDRIDRDPRVEVVIIGRGGGSGEDLMAFNDERVVRRVARMRVPTVSAIGHEIDTSLTDLVADVRAATPSQAAELVVADQRQRKNDLIALCRRLLRGMRARLLEDRSALNGLQSRLGDPRFVLSQQQQELDELRTRAERALRRRLGQQSARNRALARRLLGRHPRLVIANSRAALNPLAARLRHIVQLRVQGAANRLDGDRARLGALSPFAVLGRGYAIALTEEGRVISSADAVETGELVRVRLHRGVLRAEVLEALPEVAATLDAEVGGAPAGSRASEDAK